MSFFDASALDISISGSTGTTNGTSQVIMVPAPEAGLIHFVTKNGFSVFNADTASASFSVVFNNGSSTILQKTTMNPGDVWHGSIPNVLNEPTETFRIVLDAGPTTNELSWTISYVIQNKV